MKIQDSFQQKVHNRLLKRFSELLIQVMNIDHKQTLSYIDVINFPGFQRSYYIWRFLKYENRVQNFYQ